MDDADTQILDLMAKLIAFKPVKVDDRDYFETLFALTLMLCPEQRWHYLQLVCFASIRLVHLQEQDPLLEGLASRENLIQMLAFNHRINQALHFRLFHTGEVEDFPIESRFPARRWNFPGTDRWITAETLRDQFATLQRRAAALPPSLRRAWAKRAIVSSCRTSNNRLKDAALWKLTQHAAALNGVRWKRLTAPRADKDNVVHVRLAYSTGLFSVTVRIGSKVVARRRPWMMVLGPPQTQEERAMVDSHYFVRLMSVRVFDLLTMLREADPARTETSLIPLLRAFYDLLLAPLLDRYDVAEAIAALGGRPTLVVATHGSLSQLPFAALHDGEGYLLDRFDVVQAPPIYDTAEFGGGVLDDDAMTGGKPVQFPLRLRLMADTSDAAGLPGATDEREQYRAMFADRADAFSCMDAGQDWDGATLRWLLGEPGVGILSAHVRPALDGARSLAIETPQRRLLPVVDALTDTIGADLVVLTGCGSVGQTDWIGGQEDSLVSLCRRRGAQSVIGTLWPIDDRAAARYNEALVAALAEGRSRAAAHGAAQRAVRETVRRLDPARERLVRPGIATHQAAPTETMDHPYFWAPFQLSGAWR